MSKKKSSPKATEKTLLDQLITFYWAILEDPDLKPSDRIASARRLEALLASEQDETPAPVQVVLNLPPKTEQTP